MSGAPKSFGGQSRSRAMQVLLGETKKKPERVAVCGNRRRRDILLGEPVEEEPPQERCDGEIAGSHDRTSAAANANLSKRLAATCMSSGKPERYQYVSLALACPR